MVSLEVRVGDLGLDDFFVGLNKQNENIGISWGNSLIREF